MAIPAFGAAGTGATATLGAAAATGYPASLADGQTIWCGTLSLVSLAGYDDSALLAAGFALIGDRTFSTVHRARVYWKRSDGTETGSVNITSPTLGTVKTRMYSSTGSLDDGGQFYSLPYELDGTDDTIEMPTVPVAGDAAAFGFVFVADDNALASATGEAGGNWAEVADFANATGDDGAMQLQTSSLIAGPLSGGAQTMAASDPWCVIAFAVRNVRQVRIGTGTDGTSSSSVDFSCADHTLLAAQFGDSRTIVMTLGMGQNANALTVGSATYEGVAATLAVSVANAVDISSAAIFYLDEADLPADGANTPTFDNTATASGLQIGGRCEQYEGLAQGGPVATASDDDATVDVSASSAGQFLIGTCAIDSNFSFTWTTDGAGTFSEIHDTSMGATARFGSAHLLLDGTDTTVTVTGTDPPTVTAVAWWGADADLPELEASASESIGGASDAGVAAAIASVTGAESIGGASDAGAAVAIVAGVGAESLFGATDAGLATVLIQGAGSESIASAQDVGAAEVLVQGSASESLAGASDAGAASAIVSALGTESIGGALDSGVGEQSILLMMRRPKLSRLRELAAGLLATRRR